jgi:hypothetical protein
MTTNHVLALPNFNEVFIVETDACDIGIGAVLMQHGQPVAFLSKAMGKNTSFFLSMRKNFWLLSWLSIDGDNICSTKSL